jgi:hypothetical protein
MANLVVSAIPRDLVAEKALGSLLGVVGALCLRFVIHALGDASARNPRAALKQRRAVTQ